MTDSRPTELTTTDGRTLEVRVGGDVGGFPWLYHSGSPSGAVAYPDLEALAAELGLLMVTYSRPGYGGSTPRPLPEGGPRVVEDVTDSLFVLDSLGIGDFITLGWSGGGPRALACAALLPERCRAAAVLAGVAPRDAGGLDWFEGMGQDNVDEFTAAGQGIEAYEAHLEREMAPLFNVTGDQLAAGLGDLLPPVDQAALTGSVADYLSASFRHAGKQGVVGARDDGLAMFAPWGFDLSEISVPVAIWQGRQDAMVPYGHGVWLAENVPNAQAHLFEDEGHISLVNRLDEILADLKSLAGVK